MIIRGTRASAGTLSPTRTSRMSPGTTSSASMPRVQLGWRDVERLQRCTWYPSNQSLPHMEQPQKPGFSRPFTHRPLEMIPHHPIQSQGAPWDAMFAPYHSGVGTVPLFKVGYNGYNQHVPVTKSVALDGYRDELLQEGKLLYLKGSNGVAWNLAPPSSPPSYD